MSKISNNSFVFLEQNRMLTFIYEKKEKKQWRTKTELKTNLCDTYILLLKWIDFDRITKSWAGQFTLPYWKAYEFLWYNSSADSVVLRSGKIDSKMKHLFLENYCSCYCLETHDKSLGKGLYILLKGNYYLRTIIHMASDLDLAVLSDTILIDKASRAFQAFQFRKIYFVSFILLSVFAPMSKREDRINFVRKNTKGRSTIPTTNYS